MPYHRMSNADPAERDVPLHLSQEEGYSFTFQQEDGRFLLA